MVDRVLLRVREGVRDVVGLQAEVASRMNAHRGLGAELGDPLCDRVGIERVLSVCVRAGDDVGGAGAGGEVQHGDAVLARRRPVVETVENVAVDVDEACHRGSSASR